MKLKQAKTVKQTKKHAHVKERVYHHYKENGGILGTDVGVLRQDLADILIAQEHVSLSTAQRWIDTLNPFTNKQGGMSMISFPTDMDTMMVKFGEVSTASKIASLASMLQDAVTMGEAIEEMEDMMYDEDIVMAHESQVNALLGIICDTMENNSARMDSLSERIKQIKDC
jgi:hypothetical protein